MNTTTTTQTESLAALLERIVDSAPPHTIRREASGVRLAPNGAANIPFGMEILLSAHLHGIWISTDSPWQNIICINPNLAGTTSPYGNNATQHFVADEDAAMAKSLEFIEEAFDCARQYAELAREDAMPYEDDIR